MEREGALDLERQFALMHGDPIQAIFKHVPEDFVVEEPLAFELSGEGEHLYVQVNKNMRTTLDAKRALARWAGVLMKHVSHSGLKDKWADTVQWFSIQLPGKDNPDPAQFNEPNVSIVQMQRHSKKLRIGAHKVNRFTIRVRQIEALDQFLDRLEHIKQAGVPNYFGEQRFGLQRNNLNQAVDCLLNGRRCKREQRSMYLSAVRSYFFNLLVSARIEQQTISRYVPGDVLQLSGSRSCFQPEAWSDELQQRLDGGDVNLTTALIGVDGVQADADSLAFEDNVLAPHSVWLEYVKRINMKALRRQMILRIDDLQWRVLGEDVELSFTLPAGSFATAVLRELIVVADPKPHQML